MLKGKSGDQPEQSHKKTVSIAKRRKMFHGEYVASGQVPRDSIPILPDTDAFIDALDTILKVSEPHVVFVCQEVKDKLDVLKKRESEIRSTKRKSQKQLNNDRIISEKAQRASLAIKRICIKTNFMGQQNY